MGRFRFHVSSMIVWNGKCSICGVNCPIYTFKNTITSRHSSRNVMKPAVAHNHCKAYVMTKVISSVCFCAAPMLVSMLGCTTFQNQQLLLLLSHSFCVLIYGTLRCRYMANKLLFEGSQS